MTGDTSTVMTMKTASRRSRRDSAGERRSEKQTVRDFQQPVLALDLPQLASPVFEAPINSRKTTRRPHRQILEQLTFEFGSPQ